MRPRPVAINLPINITLTERVVKERLTPDLEIHNQDGRLILRARYQSYTLSGERARINYDSLNVLPRTGNSRRIFQYNCNHALYSPACGAATQYVPATITAKTGNELGLIMLPQPDHYYAGGIIKYGTSRYWVAEHTGTTLITYQRTPDLVVGLTVEITPGCDRTTTTCRSVFRNIERFGGFPEYRGNMWDKPLINTDRGF